jgi:hypothetical protein
MFSLNGSIPKVGNWSLCTGAKGFFNILANPTAGLAFRRPVFIVAGVNVLALTILISTCLAGIFIVCFAVEARRSRRSSPERDSLLPLDLEVTNPASPTATAELSAKH